MSGSFHIIYVVEAMWKKLKYVKTSQNRPSRLIHANGVMLGN